MTTFAHDEERLFVSKELQRCIHHFWKSEILRINLASVVVVLGVLALVFGLISFLTGAICTCPFSIAGGFLPLVVAVLGIVFGFLGISKSKKAGCKNVLGVIAIILSALSAVSILLLVIANVVLDLTGVADQLTF